MLTTLIRRELLDNLMTFRFAAAVFITLLLVVVNTAVLLKDYEQRLMDYNDAVKTHQRQMQAKKTYSAGEVRIDRPPNPLSIFSAGYDKRVGNQVQVSHTYVPSLWDAGWHGADNPFMDMFASMDIVFIFEVILSLFALIFAYDTLAGEYERGTLRLVLNVARPPRACPACQIHQCDDLSTRAIAYKPSPRRHLADDDPFYFPEHR